MVGFPFGNFRIKACIQLPKLIAVYHVLHRLSVPRHPPYALKRLIYAQKIIFLSKLNLKIFIYSNILDCSSIRTIGYRYCLIVPTVETIKIDIHYLQFKNLKVSMVEDSGIEPLTSECKSGALPAELIPREKWWAEDDSNVRPHPYQGCALTT